MPLKGILKTGDRYTITVDSDPTTPGTTAMALVWIPNLGGTPVTPVIDAIAPGTRALHAGIVPQGQMLMLDFDLPDDPKSKITIDVTSAGASVAAGAESADNEWTFLVTP